MNDNGHKNGRPNQNFEAEFKLAERSSYLRVDLDALWNNVKIVKSLCSPHTEIIAVVKGNAYGHGSVGMARHLESKGVKHFAVGAAYEGRKLRRAGIKGFIQVFGNSVAEEIGVLRSHKLTPTVATETFLKQWAAWTESGATHREKHMGLPPVVIKVDSGMSRNGCQPDELPRMVDLCKELHIPIHSMMTHFATAWSDAEFAREQYETFLAAVQPYRDQGIKVHVANSEAVIRGMGNDLDFVRPGVALYGLTADDSEESIMANRDLGLKPILSWVARPCLIKQLDPGRCVGYDRTYVVGKECETIATFSLGSADGYNPQLSNKGVLTSVTGQEYPVVGAVSMDAITVKVDQTVDLSTPFYVYRNDLTSSNCVTCISHHTEQDSVKECLNLSARVPRLYITGETVSTANGRMATVTRVDDRIATVAMACGSLATVSSEDAPGRMATAVTSEGRKAAGIGHG